MWVGIAQVLSWARAFAASMSQRRSSVRRELRVCLALTLPEAVSASYSETMA